MTELFVGESRNHVAITDERDCLDCETIRVETRVFVDHAHVMSCARAYEARGFAVSIQYGDHEYFTKGAI